MYISDRLRNIVCYASLVPRFHPALETFQHPTLKNWIESGDEAMLRYDNHTNQLVATTLKVW